VSDAPDALVLYGPPAVGKSTVTNALTDLDARFRLHPVVKAGAGRTAGYRTVSGDRFAELAAAGRLVVTWERYGARYGVARSALVAALDEGHVPVVHLGSVAAVRTLTATAAVRWTVVQLWARREVCAARARARATGDLAARLRAYDESARLDDLAAITVNTGVTNPAETARRVRCAVTHCRQPDTPKDTPCAETT
jgi:guanylate kinase